MKGHSQRALNHRQTRRQRQSGFAILETIIALAVCGIMATSLVIAMQRIASLSFNAKRESSLSRIIHNQLLFATTKPNIEEGKTSIHVEEWDVDLETIITPIEDLLNEEEVELNRLYLIEVHAVWWADGEYVKRSAETWRHADMYVQ